MKQPQPGKGKKSSARPSSAKSSVIDQRLRTMKDGKLLRLAKEKGHDYLHVKARQIWAGRLKRRAGRGGGSFPPPSASLKGNTRRKRVQQFSHFIGTLPYSP